MMSKALKLNSDQSWSDKLPKKAQDIVNDLMQVKRPNNSFVSKDRIIVQLYRRPKSGKVVQGPQIDTDHFVAREITKKP